MLAMALHSVYLRLTQPIQSWVILYTHSRLETRLTVSRRAPDVWMVGSTLNSL